MNTEDKNTKNDAYKSICDKKTIEAIEMLGSVNLERADRMKECIIKRFYETKQIVDYPQYRKIVQDQSSERQIKIDRRVNMHDLGDVDNLEDE